jgi:general secretion pathway protein K
MSRLPLPAPPRDDGQAGFAVLMVLLFLLAVTAIVAPLVLGARTDVVVAANRLQQGRLESIARGLVTVLARELAAPPLETRNEELTVRSAPMRCRDPRYLIEARVQDQNGLIGINSAPKELVAAGLQALGFGTGDTSELTDALIAYRTLPPPAGQRDPSGDQPPPGPSPAAGTEEIVLGGLKLKPFEAIEELYDFKGFRGVPVRALNEVFSIHNSTETIVGPRLSGRLSRILPAAPSPSYPSILGDEEAGAKVYRIDVEVRAAAAGMSGYAGAVVAASENESGAFGILERTSNPEFLPEGESDFSGAVDCAMIFGQGVAAALAADTE